MFIMEVVWVRVRGNPYHVHNGSGVGKGERESLSCTGCNGIRFKKKKKIREMFAINISVLFCYSPGSLKCYFQCLIVNDVRY